MPLIPKREPTGTFQIGAGFTTDDGFIATAKIAQTSLFGTDKQLSLSARISEREQDMRLTYVDPTLLDAPLTLRGDVYTHTRTYPGFMREAAGGDVSLTARVTRNLDVFVGYRGERVSVHSSPLSLARSTTPGEPPWRGGFLSALRAGVTYSDVDRPHDPMRGTQVGSSIEIADRQLGSDLDYLRTDAWLGHHRPLGPFTLHLGARASSITDVPISERLHFDGSRDVRGFAPSSVGPRDPVTGLPTGGNFLWSARGELEAPLVGDLAIAGFVDVGGLHDRLGGETAASAGFGVIWRSPIGPLRFDVAYPLTGDDRGPRFLFGLGGAF